MRDSKDELHCPLCGCGLIWLPVSHVFVCESCKQSFNERAEFYLRHKTKAAVGNEAAMRKALESVAAWLLERFGNPADPDHDKAEVFYILATGVLAAPPRNCDVGTPEEQYDRHDKYCNLQPTCIKCLRVDAASMCISCFAKWAQRPYGQEGGEE